MPSSRACRGEASVTSWPSTSTPPSSGGTAPAAILRSVVFPAPLSPRSPCTSPGQRARSAACSARTWPYHFDTRRSSSTGVAEAFTGAPGSSPSLRLRDVDALAVLGVVDVLLRQRAEADQLLRGQLLPVQRVHGRLDGPA